MALAILLLLQSHTLRALKNKIPDSVGQQWGFPHAPDCPQSVQSNTPDGVAFPLLTVARSCTSAQEERGAVAPRQECAGSGTISPWEISRVRGSITMIFRPIFCA